MTLLQKTIVFALILSFILATLGVAEEQVGENFIQALKERVAHLEKALSQLAAKLEKMSGPPRRTSNSDVDVNPEQHRLEIERALAQHEIDVEAQKRKLELEQDLAQRQSEQQRNIITFSAEQEAETTKFQYEMELSVQEREYEMKREVERARIEQEQAVQESDIEKNLAIETKQIEQHRQVQEADIERNLASEKARIVQGQEIEKAHIEKYTAIQLAEIDAELERQKKKAAGAKEMQILKEELASIEKEHREKMATLTKLAVFPLNVNASEIADLVKPFLSEHAIISVDDDGKVLVIRDVENCVKDAEMIVEKLNVLRAEGNADSAKAEDVKKK